MNDPQSTFRTGGHNPPTTDGILVIDKPSGWTSHDVVARVRKILKTRRVGHTGTLDPFATGVLVVCVNRATRLVQFLTGDDKEYIATMRLGFATDTGDLTGEPLSAVTNASMITSDQVLASFNHFRGPVRQTPPMYSAKKIGGVRLHELARRGEVVERQPVNVEIKDLDLIVPSKVTAPQVQDLTKDFSFRVVCSSGTYVRTLAEDIGKFLGVGAHLVALRRTRAGRCDLSQAVTLESLGELAESGGLGEVFTPMAEALDFHEIRLDAERCKAVVHGRSIRHPGDWPVTWVDGMRAKLCDANRQLLAVAEFESGAQLWHPRVVLGAADLNN